MKPGHTPKAVSHHLISVFSQRLLVRNALPVEGQFPKFQPATLVMKAADKVLLALVTAPEMKTARKLARAALEARLVACANLLGGIESHYWWEGKLERSPEVLILFKTTRANQRALERLMLGQHPYDTPEFVTLPPEAATDKYLEWWIASCR